MVRHVIIYLNFKVQVYYSKNFVILTKVPRQRKHQAMLQGIKNQFHGKQWFCITLIHKLFLGSADKKKVEYVAKN